MVGVNDGLLFIERKTIFGTKWTEFEASQIKSIEMESANWEVNGVPVMNLHIKPHDKDAVTMLSHLDNAEIKWLAQQLRQSLGVEPQDSRFDVGNFDLAAPLAEVPATDIKVSQEPTRTSIHVPQYRFPGERSSRFVLLLFMTLPLPGAILARMFFRIDFTVIIFAVLVHIAAATMFFVLRIFSSREFYITVTDTQLEIQREGFLSERNFKIDKPDILEVDVVDSGVKFNNKSQYCVKVKGRHSRQFTMMTSRDENELVYVARLIYQRLKLSDKSREP